MGRPVGVLLLNMGGPDSLASIQPFLHNLFSDRDIIRFPGGRAGQWLLARLISRVRASRVRSRYEAIGGRSPIRERTRAQAAALEHVLSSAENLRWLVRPAMRYWHPFAFEALEELRDAGVTDVIALTMYPHYTRATTGSSVSELERLFSGEFDQLELSGVIDRWPTLPGYLDALAERVREELGACEGEPVVLFSAHGLPVSFVEAGDTYVDDINATVAGVMERLPAGVSWRLSYQSRVGPAKWLEPRTPDMLATLADEGIREVVVVPVSFVTDHLETQYEIQIEFAELARNLGFREFRVCRALNDDARLMDGLATLVEDAAESLGDDKE